jgi:hypothetical protein
MAVLATAPGGADFSSPRERETMRTKRCSPVLVALAAGVVATAGGGDAARLRQWERA